MDPFEAGFVARWTTIALVKARNHKYLGRLWKRSPGLLTVFNICIKVKPFEHLAEAHAMRFVARHTSVPVPKVHYAFIHRGETYIVMGRIKGHVVWHGWLGRSHDSKTRILKQLRQMLAELRSVPQPAGVGVSNVVGGAFCDCRLPSKMLWGPYATTRGFHQALATGADLELQYENLPADVSELLDFYRGFSNDLVLTHGDLSSFNIMVQGDEVMAIVDWETAGWFPPYWEYTCARNANPQNAFWAQEVDHFLPPRPHELRMEGIRRKHFGDFY